MNYNDENFHKLTDNIIKTDKFKKLKECKHHGITRYEHSIRVAFYTYKITKKLKLNYKEATRAALLHDYFTKEVKDLNGYQRLIKHPTVALENASKDYELTELEKDIIKKHMFPVTKELPKYKESWIVDIVDDVASIYERIKAFNMQIFK